MCFTPFNCLLPPQTCTEEDCAIYSTCVSCSFGIVGSTLQQQDLAACESQCGNIEIRQVGSTNEISNPDSVHRCTMPLVGDTCVVEYYFQFIQGMETQSTLYVINSVTSTYSKIACEGCCRCLDVWRYDLHLLYIIYVFSSSVVLHQLNWTKQELDVLWNRGIFGSLSPQNTFAPREPAISTAVQFICLVVCVATWVVLLVWAHRVYCMCLWCTQLHICNMCLCPSNLPCIQWISCNL